jgi:anti-sigma B factor antagonist
LEVAALVETPHTPVAWNPVESYVRLAKPQVKPVELLDGFLDSWSQTMELKISDRVVDGVVVLDCSGRLVFGDESGMLRDKVKVLISEGTKKIILNLRDVTYIDSGGLGTLVGLYSSARAAGADIKLAQVAARVGQLLQVTKLLTVFDVKDSVEAAAASFK